VQSEGAAAAPPKKADDPKVVRDQRLEGGRKLYTAVRRGQVAVVREVLLLEHIDLNCRDRELNTPLHWAAKLGHAEVTALHLAAAAGKAALVRLLRERPALDPDLKTRDGLTAHKLAVRGKHAEVADILSEPMPMRHGSSTLPDPSSPGTSVPQSPAMSRRSSAEDGGDTLGAKQPIPPAPPPAGTGGSDTASRLLETGQALQEGGEAAEAAIAAAKAASPAAGAQAPPRSASLLGALRTHVHARAQTCAHRVRSHAQQPHLDPCGRVPAMGLPPHCGRAAPCLALRPAQSPLPTPCQGNPSILA